METHDNRVLRTGILVALLAASIMWWDSIALYPVKLFVVLLHELAHGLAAVATGGSIVRIEISELIGGLAVTQGGWELLVVSSGYIGSMVFGGLILLGAQRTRIVRPLAAGIGVLVLGVTLLYIRNGFGLVFGSLAGAALVAAARWLPRLPLEVALQYLGAASCLYALVDVKEDLLTTEHRLTDATILQNMTGVPALVWGVLFSLLALVVFVVIMRRAWRAAREG